MKRSLILLLGAVFLYGPLSACTITQALDNSGGPHTITGRGQAASEITGRPSDDRPWTDSRAVPFTMPDKPKKKA